MSFDLEEFPQTLTYEMDRIPQQKKIKSQSDNRFVNRSQDWHRPFRQFKLRFPVQDSSDLDTTENFWFAHNFSDDGEDAFLVEDPRDNSVETDKFGTGDGDTKEFRLKIDYSYGKRTYNELARFVKSGTLSVFEDGTETQAYSVDDSNGVVTFDSAPASGTELTASYNYLRKVIFLEDDLQQAFVDDLHTDVEFTLQEVP